MAWTGNTDALNQFTPKNYMYGSFVFLLDEITQSSCAYLIGDLTNYVLSEENHGKQLTFVINSPGGNIDTMSTIIGLINVAKLNNFTIDSLVFGTAASAASIIAIQADNRYMSNISHHFIHFGTKVDVTQKVSEIDKIYKQSKEYANMINELYLQACKGKLSEKQLLEIIADEQGFLNADQCLKYGLCDKIVENDLRAMEQDKDKQKELLKEFEAYRKTKKAKKSKKNQ